MNWEYLRVNPVDWAVLCVCLITVWWLRSASRMHRIVLAVLGVLAASVATRMIDAVIAALLVGAAFVFEFRSASRWISRRRCGSGM